MTDRPLEIRPTATGVRIGVRAVTRASRSGVDGVRDGQLVVRVTAPPVDQAANEAIVRTMADALDLPRRAIRIAVGLRGRNKSVDVDGLDAEELRRRLDRVGGVFHGSVTGGARGSSGT